MRPLLPALTLPLLLAGGCVVWSHTTPCECTCTCDCTGDDCTGCGDSAAPTDTAGSPWRAPPLAAVIEASTTAGPVPLRVTLDAAGSSGAWTVAQWDLGEGTPVTGTRVQHTYLAAGVYQVDLDLRDRFGQQAHTSVTIDVELASCPGQGEGEELGVVAYEGIAEASGLVDSRRNPGVLWVHNDSGDSARLYALNHSGEHLGVWEIDGASARDWEDLTTGQDPDTGAWLLYIGDIGDNPQTRDTIDIYRVAEPLVDADGGEQGGTLTAERIELDYPDEQSFNAETLMLDPATGDLFVVTKSYDGKTGVFRKPAPHRAGERTTLEEVAWLDFSEEPLSGNATTSGAFGPLGDRFVIRTYATTAHLWLRDGADSVAEALEAEPCTVAMPSERQAETITFSAQGDALLSISEGEAQPIHRVPLVP